MRGIELRGNAPRGNDLRVIVTQPSGRVSAPNPAGGGGLTAHSALPDFLAGAKGLLPLTKKPTPLSAFAVLPPYPMKNPRHAHVSFLPARRFSVS